LNNVIINYAAAEAENGRLVDLRKTGVGVTTL